MSKEGGGSHDVGGGKLSGFTLPLSQSLSSICDVPFFLRFFAQGGKNGDGCFRQSQAEKPKAERKEPLARSPSGANSQIFLQRRTRGSPVN